MRRHQLIALFVLALFSLSLIAAGCGGDGRHDCTVGKGDLWRDRDGSVFFGSAAGLRNSA